MADLKANAASEMFSTKTMPMDEEPIGSRIARVSYDLCLYSDIWETTLVGGRQNRQRTESTE